MSDPKDSENADSKQATPAPGGHESELADNTAAVTCYYDGSNYGFNARICDGNRQEWQCGTNGWYRTGRVCVN